MCKAKVTVLFWEPHKTHETKCTQLEWLTTLETRYCPFSPLCCFSYMHFVLICTLVVLYCFVMCVCVCMCVCGFCNVWVFWGFCNVWGCFGNMYTVLWLRYFLTWLRFFLPRLRFFRAFSSVVRKMPE